ncbi:MAG TPA: M28 family peptidase [Pirellulales bacterium]|nr:M28 family peptidase [Pirellulales bacterium]
MTSLEHALKADVEALAIADGRLVGTAGHEIARRYLLGRMAEIGLMPYRGDSFDLPYTHGYEFHNLVGMVRGLTSGTAPVLVGAHYDSALDAPCADDNAAAVAIALAAAERLLAAPPARDVIVALFDAEEAPFYWSDDMGSVRLYHDHRPPTGFHAAVVMDLVGHDVSLPLPVSGPARERIANLLFMTGAESHPRLSELVRRTPRPADLPLVATLNRNVGKLESMAGESAGEHRDLSDHYVFRTHGVPYLFLSCGQWAHYHQPTDTPERLNYVKMARICEFLLALIGSLAEEELSRAEGPAGIEVDTTALEIELLHEAFGPALPLVQQVIGLPRIATRGDLDTLARRVQRFFWE